MELDLDCCVCLRVVVDPVVLKCGHDACKGCLSSILRHKGSSRAATCPLCRAEFGEQELQNLVPSFRLKHLLEALAPEQMASRKRELQAAQQNGYSAAVDASGVEHGILTEQGQVAAPRPRRMSAVHAGRQYLRARRTRPPPAEPAGVSPATGAEPVSLLETPLVARPNNPVVSAVVQLLQAGTAASGPVTNGAGYAGAAGPGGRHGSMVAHGGTSAPGVGAGSPGGGAWVSPSHVMFTMGWWEAPPSECRRRRGRSGRVQQRHSVRVQ